MVMQYNVNAKANANAHVDHTQTVAKATRGTAMLVNSRMTRIISTPQAQSAAGFADLSTNVLLLPTHRYGPIMGAGVFLMLAVNHREVLLLFRERGVFTDPGGACDRESPFECATRELEEESMGTFRLDAERLQDYTLRYRDYLGVIVPVQTADSPLILQRLYRSNLAFLRTQRNVPHEWMETDDLAFFFMDDLAAAAGTLTESSLISDTFSVPDIHGRGMDVSDRVIGVVKQMRLQSFAAGTLVTTLRQIVCPHGIGRMRTSLREATKGKTSCYTAV